MRSQHQTDSIRNDGIQARILDPPHHLREHNLRDGLQMLRSCILVLTYENNHRAIQDQDG